MRVLNILKSIFKILALLLKNIHRILTTKKFEYRNCNYGSSVIKKRGIYQGAYSGSPGYYKPHGHGIITYENGDVYEGDWKEGDHHGKGRLEKQNGEVYEGNFKRSKFISGKVVEFLKECTYEGDFKEGKYHGKGKMKWDGGAVYEGDWKEGDLHGKGIYKWDDGGVYEGDWEEGDRHGKGIMKWDDGRVYEGDWKDNRRHGKGIMKYASGNVYEGDWKDDQLHGKGIYKYANGDVYEGDLKDSWLHGKGIMKYAGGEVYEGDWKDDKRHGKGIMKWPSGNVYEGDLKDGVVTGKGIANWPDKGDVYEGDWKDFKPFKGVWKYSNGDIYEGDLVDKKRHGYGVLFKKESGKFKIGLWAEDELQDEIISRLVESGNYSEALELCKNKNLEHTRRNKGKSNSIKGGLYKHFNSHDIPDSGIFRKHYKMLIKKFTNEMVNSAWSTLIEKESFKELPLPAYQMNEISVGAKRAFPEILRIGTLSSGYSKSIKLPLFIPFSGSKGLSFIVDSDQNRLSAQKAIELIAFRLLFSIQDGKSKFYIIDPENCGASFSGLFGLEKDVLEKEIWDDESEIREGLKSIKNSIPDILKGLLTTKYKNLIEYNNIVSHSKQPFQFLLINGFPMGFTQESTELLLSIMKNGPKAGVYCLMSIDNSCQPPYNEFEFDKFRNISIEYEYSKNRLYNLPGLDILNKYNIDEIDCTLPDDIENQKEIINKNLSKSVKIQIETVPEGLIWERKSAKGITIPVGLSSEGSQMNLKFGDGATVHHALIGGATGTGKTVLLHNIIINGAKLYHPDELQFILMDYKEGTEFNIYRNLPHLKALIVSSEIEYGLSVIEFLSEEIEKRGGLFKSAGVSDFSEYKNSGKGNLPRYLVIMDEFQVLLNPQKRTTSRITSLIEDITRRGRSFGINLIFSTQSLGDVELSVSTLSQIGVRIAMAMPAHDCVRILNIDNDVPVRFSKAGQAVYNNFMGQKEGNSIFQVAFIEKHMITDELNKIPGLNKKKYIENQFVFDGNSLVKFEENAACSELLDGNKLSANNTVTDIYIGEPVYISNNHISYKLRRQHESNLLIVGDDPKAAISVAYYSIYQLALQSTPGSKFYILDMFSLESGLQGAFNDLAGLNKDINIHTKTKSAEKVIEQIEEELNLRFEESGGEGKIILCLMNINSFRLLKRTEYEPSPLASKLNNIIKEGPEYGIHTIIHSLNRKSLENIFEYNIFSEFENKIILKGANPADFGSETDDVISKENTGFLLSPVSKYDADKFKIYNH